MDARRSGRRSKPPMVARRRPHGGRAQVSAGHTRNTHAPSGARATPGRRSCGSCQDGQFDPRLPAATSDDPISRQRASAAM